MQQESQTPRQSQRPALRLATILLGSGTMHFAKPEFFDNLVPTQLPGDARTYTNVSGVAELAIGTALLVPRTRRLGGGLAALLFVAVFPANINMAVDWLRSSKTTNAQKALALLRLPLQIPLITESLKARRRA
ncbi:DoxX family protein [Rhodococcus marinonascens]|uniref:DoxX family protein n=1 Tax=Rhodococcus marinonascens TaxID=38311 RepID=UPI0009355FA4|nr:MauE/DoxX family redox-associated membrane protein [Rhodococcus marinonascens]